MSGSSAAAAKDIKSVIDSRPMKFVIETRGGKWECQLHSDRASYERNYPRSGSSSSANSINSSSTSTSK